MKICPMNKTSFLIVVLISAISLNVFLYLAIMVKMIIAMIRTLLFSIHNCLEEEGLQFE